MYGCYVTDVCVVMYKCYGVYLCKYVHVYVCMYVRCVCMYVSVVYVGYDMC